MAKSNVEAPIFEDSVECFFFSSPKVEVNWETLCQQLNSTIQILSKDYIWHKEEFRVHLPLEQDKIDGNKKFLDLVQWLSKKQRKQINSGRSTTTKPCHLASLTCFGDNIEDEWFIIYLVLELSKHYQDLIIQVKDNDGEFLLIEAAEYLPVWANPESTNNRVFIYRNQVHIIPPNLQNTDSTLGYEDAIKIIAEVPEKTKASSKVQQSILQRIGLYPEKIQENFHNATAKLPVDIATLLTLKPALIASLVSSFCNHDVIDAKACKSSEFADCVFVNVKFTKCLYAMLMHAKPPRNLKFKKRNDKKSVIGQKLTFGYQFLNNKQTLDIFSTKQFKHFMNKLNGSGYFKCNIEGSVSYNELLNNAKEFYSVMECPINSKVSYDISQLIVSNEFSQTKAALLQNNVSDEGLQEDNDDWLNINPDQLNNLLNSCYGKKAKIGSDSVITAQTVKSKLSSFFMQTSDFEGIETNKLEDTSQNIDFNPDDFANSVQNMLNIITLGNNENYHATNSDDDDYFESGDEFEEVDEELNAIKQENPQDSKAILQNIIQSMKEEGLSGPSSNLMKTIGFNKTDLLDSDDDE